MRVLKFLRYVLGFGLARALLFASPIFLANLLPLDTYGQFEMAQSYAAVGALLFGLGLSGTVPLIRLRKEIEGRWDTLLLLVAALAGLCLLVAGLASILFRTAYSLPVLTFLIIAALMMQGLWATTLKSEGRSTSAVFLEAGFWVVAVAGACLVAVGGGFLSESTISFSLLLYAMGLMAVTLTYYFRSFAGAFDLGDLRRNISLGLPLMFTSILTVIISSSGRLVLGHTSGIEVVGIYAVLYRSTTLPLVGHQVLIIGVFRQIFSWSEDVLRSRASLIVGGVTAMVMCFWILEPLFGWLLGHRFVEIFAIYRAEGLILLVQTILWSGIALNDLINSRLQIAGSVAMLTAPFLVLGGGALAVWTSYLAQSVETGDLLRGFILGHSGLMTAFYIVQCIGSWRLGYRFIRLWLAVIGATFGSGLTIFIGERFF